MLSERNPSHARLLALARVSDRGRQLDPYHQRRFSGGTGQACATLPSTRNGFLCRMVATFPARLGFSRQKETAAQRVAPVLVAGCRCVNHRRLRRLERPSASAELHRYGHRNPGGDFAPNLHFRHAELTSTKAKESST